MDSKANSASLVRVAALGSFLSLLFSATPVSAQTTFRANSGGPSYSGSTATWQADSNYSSSNTYSTGATITNTADATLYKTERWGANFSYNVPVINGSYTLNLHFAEIAFNSPGQRKFNVSAEGTQILSNYDIVAATGASNRAVVKSFPVTVSDGQLNLAFTGVVENAKVSAIELVPISSTIHINSGGSSYSGSTATWQADSDYSGSSSAYTTGATISNTADPTLYKSERWGSSFSYSVPVANGSYTLNLHFAEIYFNSPGQRKFNVSAEGGQVLNNYDIVADAGAANRAVIKSFPVTVSDGQLNLAFTGVVDNAKVSAIELLTSGSAAQPSVVTLSGISNGAVVSGPIFVSATASPTPTEVNFSIDGQLVYVDPQAPYYLNGDYSGTPLGYDTSLLAPGTHSVAASVSQNGVPYSSPSVNFTVASSVSSTTFSSALDVYANQPSAASLSVDQILANTTTATLSASDTDKRRAVISMYKDFGIDLSLDYQNTFSNVLLGLEPQHWSSATPQPLSGNFLAPYSVDASFYHPIPANSPRVVLPSGYFNNFQYNTVKNGDGIGIGIAISSAANPVRRIRSQWYSDTNTRVDYFMNVRPDALSFQGSNLNSDRNLSFIDSTSKTLLNGYSVTLDPDGVDYLSLYAAGVRPLGTLGDKGGTTASAISQIGPLVRPGEATNPSAPIPHAVGGPVRRVWKARTYPALSWDSFISGTDPCSGQGAVNTGLVPYGGVLQLDPALVFTPVPNTTNYSVSVGGQTLTVSLPAYRVLQAMQTYGYYVEDYGCSDMDVYTNTDDSEYSAYGGSYGVQQGIQSVITRAKFYVVPPMVKK